MINFQLWFFYNQTEVIKAFKNGNEQLTEGRKVLLVKLPIRCEKKEVLVLQLGYSLPGED